MKLMLFLLLPLALRAHAAEDPSSCLLLQSEAKAYMSLESDSDMILLREGIIVPVLERSADQQFYKVVYFNKQYWIKKENHRRGSGKLCTVYPRCFTVNKNAQIFEKPSSTSPVVSLSKRSSQLDWFGRRTITDKTSKAKTKADWYLVSVADRYGWIRGDAGSLSDKACNSSIFQSKRKWFFNGEAALQNNAPSSAYGSIATAIPNPNDVACLQNPLFQGVAAGAGQRVGVQTSYNMNSWLTLRLGVMYEQLKYKVNFLKNPHPDPGNTNCALIPVSVNDLSSGSDTITENNLMVPVGAFYRWQMGRNHSLLMGGDVNPTMTLTSGYSFTYFTGQSLSKQTENKGIIEPTKFKFTNTLEIRYIYQFPYGQDEYFGLSAFGKMGVDGRFLLGLGFYL